MNNRTTENDKAAQQIIKALALPAASRAPVAPRPLPLSRLPRLPRETSMMYGIARVDPSGRVTSRGITNAVRWRPGDRLAMTLTPVPSSSALHPTDTSGFRAGPASRSP